RASAEVHLGRQAGGARFTEEGERARGRLLGAVRAGDEQLQWRRGTRLTDLRRLAGQQDPLDPRGPAHPRRGWAAQLLDEAVISSSAADAALGSKRVGGELEHRPCVVVQAPHQRRIDLVWNVRCVEQRAYLSEVLRVLIAEM